MNSLNRFADPFYCITRLIVGLMFASHGGQLVLGMFGGMPGSDQPMMAGRRLDSTYRRVAYCIWITNAVGRIHLQRRDGRGLFHDPRGQRSNADGQVFPISSAGPQVSNKGELAIFYCWFFLFVVFYGAGRLEHRRDDGKRKSLDGDDGLAASEHRHPFYRR